MTARPRLVLASANPDKVSEIYEVIGGLVDLDPRPKGLPEVIESASTLEGNARLKAVAVCEATGRPSVADDTGLEVDALGGAPGVYSARFAGSDASYADNLARLLSEMDEIPVGRRTARFRTVALAHYPDGREVVATGTVEGTISLSARGKGGFGYDPVFVPVEGDGRTFAEMAEEKHDLSHRGRAFRVLARKLNSD